MQKPPSNKKNLFLAPDLCFFFVGFNLVAPYRAILRYYRCDTPYRAILFKGGWRPPAEWCDTPPSYLFSHRHICAISHFATYRAIIAQYPTKTSAKEFCDTIAASIARYEKYRYWASKFWRNFSPQTPKPWKTLHAVNFTKISRRISRHLWQRKTKKKFTPHFCRVAALKTSTRSNVRTCLNRLRSRKTDLDASKLAV